MNSRTLLSWTVAAVLWSDFLRAGSLPPLPDGAFTYVCVPDTQCYHTHIDESGVSRELNPSFASRIAWIEANRERERIVFVSHLGDITDDNGEAQWNAASQIMGTLDGKVPYGICPGNHDQESASGRSGDTSAFSMHFPSSRFGAQAWYGGCFPGYVNSYGTFVSGNNANSYQLFESEGRKFVILHLENNAPEPVLEWADEVLEDHADRIAIIATHMFIGYVDSASRGQAGRVPDPGSLGLLTWTKRHGREGVSGVRMWTDHFSRHANVRLIVCGDQSEVMTYHKPLVGGNGNRVDAFMQDYPRADDSDWIRLFRFLSNDTIEVYTYSPLRDMTCAGVEWWVGEKWHRFTLPISAVAEGEDIGMWNYANGFDYQPAFSEPRAVWLRPFGVLSDTLDVEMRSCSRSCSPCASIDRTKRSSLVILVK